MSASVNSGLFKLTLALVSLLVVVIILIGFVEPMASLDFTQQINILLAFAISFFALIEALSTYLQWAQANINNMLEDLRYEIENVYGVLYLMLNTNIHITKFRKENEEKEYVMFDEDDLIEFINVLVKYSYIVPNYFLEELKEKMSSWEDQGVIMLPKKYYEKINTEYRDIINQYRKLLGKNLINWEKSLNARKRTF